VIASSVPHTPAEPKPLAPPEQRDTTFYINVAENARKRAEKLERENLELSVELERLRRVSIAHAATEGNSLLYGEAG
jgi:hypothetical protein